MVSLYLWGIFLRVELWVLRELFMFSFSRWRQMVFPRVVPIYTLTSMVDFSLSSHSLPSSFLPFTYSFDPRFTNLLETGGPRYLNGKKKSRNAAPPSPPVPQADGWEAPSTI